MNSRDRILQALRQRRAPFKEVQPAPENYLPATKLDEAERSDPLPRFIQELEALNTKVHVVQDSEAAIQIVLDLVAPDKTVLAWGNLPLPGLAEALTANGIDSTLATPRGDQRAATYQQIDPIRVGITGAEAAFATTATLVLPTRDGQGRLPSLITPVHIALLRRDKLYPRMEDWIAKESREVLSQSNSVALVSGPSRTGDIEMQTILGVHGPGELHVVVF